MEVQKKFLIAVSMKDIFQKIVYRNFGYLYYNWLKKFIQLNNKFFNLQTSTGGLPVSSNKLR